MAGIALVGYAVCVVVMTTVVWLAARRRPQRAELLPPPVRSLLDAARRRAVVAVAFSGVVIVALFAAGFSWTSLVGLPVALAPALGGAAGLLLYSATPPRATPVDASAAREATLTPRTPLSFMPPAGAILLASTVLFQILFLVFAGVTSSPDEFGRYREITFETADVSSRSGPYAGWFYGVPLLVTTGVLVAATIVALWRVSSTPALPPRELSDVDEGWRRATNRIIVALSLAALLLQFGGVALQSGLSIRNGFFVGVPAVWDITGQVFAAAGVAMMVGNIASLTLAAVWSFSLPDLALTHRTSTVHTGDAASEGIPR